MQNKMKVLKNFIYLIVTDKAQKIFENELFDLYEIHYDESESLIETQECLEIALNNGSDIGIEVGRRRIAVKHGIVK